MVEVIKRFRDKKDKTTIYEIGEKLNWKDKARIEDCSKRGLVRVIETPKKTKKK